MNPYLMNGHIYQAGWAISIKLVGQREQSTIRISYSYRPLHIKQKGALSLSYLSYQVELTTKKMLMRTKAICVALVQHPLPSAMAVNYTGVSQLVQ